MNLRQLCLSVFLLPAAMFAENISGTYSVHGFDPSAFPPQYQGFVTIQSIEATAVAPDVHPDDYYVIHWNYSDFQSITGRGVRKDNYIAFEFTGDEDPSYTGVQLYKIHDEERHGHCRHEFSLRGPWVLSQGTTIGEETLTKIIYD